MYFSMEIGPSRIIDFSLAFSVLSTESDRLQNKAWAETNELSYKQPFLPI